MESNLPPGVTEDMIPGNRPEDVRWEKFVDAVFEELARLGLDCINRFDEQHVYTLIEKHTEDESMDEMSPTTVAKLIREDLEGGF